MRDWEVRSGLSSGSSPLGKIPKRVDPLPVKETYRAPQAYNFSLICLSRGWALKTEISKILLRVVFQSAIGCVVISFILTGGISGCIPENAMAVWIWISG